MVNWDLAFSDRRPVAQSLSESDPPSESRALPPKKTLGPDLF
jgi:hypothetical protein